MIRGVASMATASVIGNGVSVRQSSIPMAGNGLLRTITLVILSRSMTVRSSHGKKPVHYKLLVVILIVVVFVLTIS